MKKLLLAGAALALIAGPVAAQDTGGYAGQSYGQDAAAWWSLNAEVGQFCKLNSAGGVTDNPTNATFTGGAFGPSGGSSAEADGTVNLDIQNDSDNTIRLAGLGVTYGKSQCNMPFTVSADSLNGGLKSDTTTNDEDFVETVDYDLDVRFDRFYSGLEQASAVQGGAPIGTHPEAAAGDFRIGVRVNAQDDLLLEGTYSDFLKITMTPTTAS